MFSSRSKWDLAPNRLYRLKEEKRLNGETIIDLTESNPTFCGFSYQKEDILDSLCTESVLEYRPDPRGIRSAREAISKYYSGQGIAVNPDHILLTSGTSEAYSFLFKLLCNINDRVLVPRPSYPLFDYLCLLNDVEPFGYRLYYDSEWRIDFDTFEEGLNGRVGAIIIVNPNNPTGSYIKQDEFNRICNLAEKYNCTVIVDSVFEPYSLNADGSRAEILKYNGSALLFSLNGISKLLGLPQLKLSWTVVRGNSGKSSEALNRLEVIADTYLSVNVPVQIALPKLLQEPLYVKEQIMNRVRSNLQYLKDTTSNMNISLLNTEGGWYAILQLPQRYSDNEWAERMLVHWNILVQPGYFYDIEQKSCVVISLPQKTDKFEEGISRMCEYAGK